mmetsp:Transcript_29560/g.87442  ORF Transcript_29560/g.87442 Transcript_29560/m.87442 type:complete len:221 (-) Transcript_29560:587-1249(-)
MACGMPFGGGRESRASAHSFSSSQHLWWRAQRNEHHYEACIYTYVWIYVYILICMHGFLHGLIGHPSAPLRMSVVLTSHRACHLPMKPSISIALLFCKHSERLFSCVAWTWPRCHEMIAAHKQYDCAYGPALHDAFQLQNGFILCATCAVTPGFCQPLDVPEKIISSMPHHSPLEHCKCTGDLDLPVCQDGKRVLPVALGPCPSKRVCCEVAHTIHARHR